jgi:hypothetical protein
VKLIFGRNLFVIIDFGFLSLMIPSMAVTLNHLKRLWV